MKRFCLLLSIALFFTLFPARAVAVAQRGAAAFPRGTIVDLSYPFDSQTVYWPTAGSFELEKDFEGETEQGYYYSAYKYSAAEHGGTHIDAPVHFARGRHSVDEIPLHQLVGVGVLIDVTSQVLGNRDYQVTTADLNSWEKRNGRIPAGGILLLRTGFGKHYPDRKKIPGHR